MASNQTGKKRNKTGLLILVLLSIILMIASVVLALKFTGEDDWMIPLDNNINNPAKTGFACDTIDAPKLYPFAGGIVKVSRDRVSYLDLKGSEVFGEVVDMQTPFCTTSSNRALIGDTNGYQYLVITSDKVLYKSTTIGIIDYASINEDGYVSLVTDEPGVKGVVKIISPEGTGLFSWQSAESGYILSSKIDPLSKRVDIAIANTDGARISPMIRRFGIDGTAKGQFMPQINNLLPNLLYDKDNNTIIYGSSNLLAFNGEKQLYSINFSKIYTATSSAYGVLIIAKKQNGDSPMFYVINKNGNISEGIKLSEDVSSIAIKGKYAAVGSGNTIITIDIENIKEKSRTTISAPTIRLAFNPFVNQIIVVARDGVTTCIP